MRELRGIGIDGPDQHLPEHVRVKSGVDRGGRNLHYYLNYSREPVAVPYIYKSAQDLLTGPALAQGQTVPIGPWDVVIAREEKRLLPAKKPLYRDCP